MVTFWGRQVQFDNRGRARIASYRANIEGEVIADGAAAIDSRITAIDTAFSLSGQSMSLLIPPSTATHIGLDNTTSLSGVRIRSVSVPQKDGNGDYATGLTFRMALEADYLLSPGDSLTSYSETITYIGDGGARTQVVEVIEGAPVRQYTTEQSPVTIIQAGEAIGILDYPDANPALLPLLIDRPDGLQITRGTPRMINGAYIDFPCRWQYRMTLSADEFATAQLPLFPTPITRDVA